MKPDTSSTSQKTPSIRIIPCLDVNAGRVVKGVNFVGLTDQGDPVEIARRYNEQGADELTLLDITATTEGRDHIISIVEAVSREISIPLTIGGGIRTVADIQRLLDAGANKVSIASAAVANPDFIREAAEKFGSACLIVAIDARKVSEPDEASRWEVLSHGGSKGTGLDAIEWAKKMAEYGAGELLLTSMDRDGTKEGFDLELTRAVADAVPVPVTASGGVGNLQHLADGVLKGGASAVLAASIFHYGDYTVNQAKDFLRAQGIQTSPIKT